MKPRIASTRDLHVAFPTRWRRWYCALYENNTTLVGPVGIGDTPRAAYDDWAAQRHERGWVKAVTGVQTPPPMQETVFPWRRSPGVRWWALVSRWLK